MGKKNLSEMFNVYTQNVYNECDLIAFKTNTIE